MGVGVTRDEYEEELNDAMRDGYREVIAVVLAELLGYDEFDKALADARRRHREGS